MADLYDYLHWRGDLMFSQDPPNEVDALIFSALAYIRFGGSVESDPRLPVPLAEVLADFFSLEDHRQRIRDKQDLRLLEALQRAPRFSRVRLCHYQDLLIPEEETQFAAVTFLLDDGSAFVAFRGTDHTLVGWKEDFNMSFQDTVPAQRLALEYLGQIAQAHPLPLWLGGHSKGGNLAMFAAIHSDRILRQRILGVFNHDGPGFREYVTQNPVYEEMVPKLHTYVPQSSVIGTLLEHEEPYLIVKSSHVGIFQHEFYTWELDGPGFVAVEELTADSRFLNQTIRNWLAEMTLEDRTEAVEAIFDLLEAGQVESVSDILKPQNVFAYFKAMNRNEGIRRVLGDEFLSLVDAAKKAAQSDGAALQEV